jgi:hypothetical protein
MHCKPRHYIELSGPLLHPGRFTHGTIWIEAEWAWDGEEEKKSCPVLTPNRNWTPFMHRPNCKVIHVIPSVTSVQYSDPRDTECDVSTVQWSMWYRVERSHISLRVTPTRNSIQGPSRCVCSVAAEQISLIFCAEEGRFSPFPSR